MKNLSEMEQEDLIKNFDVTKKYTQKQVKVVSEYVNLVGLKKGDNQYSIGQTRLSYKEIADELGAPINNKGKIQIYELYKISCTMFGFFKLIFS